MMECLKGKGWRSLDLGVAKASGEVVVDQADGLHEGVTDSGTDKFEAALTQVCAQGVGFACLRGDLPQVFPGVFDWPAADKAPEIGVEAAEFLLHGQEGFGVLNGGGDFEPVADDARVGEQFLHLA